MKQIIILLMFLTAISFAQTSSNYDWVKIKVLPSNTDSEVTVYDKNGNDIWSVPKTIPLFPEYVGAMGVDSNFVGSTVNIKVYNPLEGTYDTLQDMDGVDVSITITVGEITYLDPWVFNNLREFKISTYSIQTDTTWFYFYTKAY